MRYARVQRGLAGAMAVVIGIYGSPSLAVPLSNGDFSDPVPLAGYTATGTVIGEPTGEFGLLETDGTFQRTLEQTFSVPASASTLAFDFAFSTTGIPPTGAIPDSFAVSVISALGDFLDILVVDLLGVVPDPSDGIEIITGATPIDVAFDSSISIVGFPVGIGTTFSGRISLGLPSAVLGQDVTLFFDLFDQIDDANTIAGVDNISLRTRAVPEPATLALILAGLGVMSGGRAKSSRSLFRVRELSV